MPEQIKNRYYLNNFERLYTECSFMDNVYKIDFCRRNKFYKPLPNVESLKVVFSSDNQKGAWDIATMSMRGINSCQSWGGSYKRNLIGSIVDPFVGIIYLTNQQTLSKGTKMLRRALVRYVISKKTKKPTLLLETIYGSDDNYYSSDIDVIAIFISFLLKKTNNTLPIEVLDGNRTSAYTIPNSKVVKEMKFCGKFEDGKDYCRSYRDSGISYSKSSKTYYPHIPAF